MSRPPEYDNGAHGVHDATGAYGVHGALPEGDGSGGVPNVFHPTAAATPAYEQYADPAAAHGWQGTAYDETAELPRLDAQAGPRPQPGTGGRAARRRAQRKPGLLRTHRVMVAAGAVGAASVAALIAGLSLSGSSGGGSHANESGTRSVPDGSVGTSDPASPAASGSPGGDGTGGTPSGGPSAATSASAGDEKAAASSAEPSTGATTPSGTLSTSDSRPGNSAGKGHGQGGAKKPK